MEGPVRYEPALYFYPARLLSRHDRQIAGARTSLRLGCFDRWFCIDYVDEGAVGPLDSAHPVTLNANINRGRVPHETRSDI